MRKQKTQDEKLWDYLSKKLGTTKTAKQIFNRVRKRSKVSEIEIKYKVDVRPLKDSLKIAKNLTETLSRLSVKK